MAELVAALRLAGRGVGPEADVPRRGRERFYQETTCDRLRSVRVFSGRVAELVYAYVSEAYPVRVGGSSPLTPTKYMNRGVRSSYRSSTPFGYFLHDVLK